ncbi:MAG: trigger factor [Clostridia bacterium]|nr:trigger factor [Deltaproteobacteria bacterium]
MDVSLDKPSSYLRKVSITVPAKDVDAVFEKIYKELGKTANIPGFRPGKAPRGLLDKHFGGRVQSEVQSRLVSDTLFRAIGEKNENPIDMPKVEPGSLAQGAEFSYTAEFEVQPDIKLTRYKELEVAKVDATVTDEVVDAQIEDLRRNAGQLVPVIDRTIAQHGDTVIVDFEGTMEGKPLQGGKADNASVEIGGENYIPGFAEGLEGAEVPGTKTLNLNFPADYTVADLSGKPVTFEITLKELKTKKLPELDDEFAKDQGEESLLALRGKIRDELQKQKDASAKDEQRALLMDALVKANPFELPPSLIRSQSERMIESATERLKQYTGGRAVQLSPQEIEGLHASNALEAEQQVRGGLLLLEVSKEEKIEAVDDDVDQEIEKLAAGAGENIERLRMAYNAPQVRQSLRYRVLEEKVVDFLLGASKTPEA